MESVIALVKSIRQAKLESEIQSNVLVDLQIKKGVDASGYIGLIKKLAGLKNIEYVDVVDGIAILSPLGEFAIKVEVDAKKAMEKLQKDLDDVIFEIERSKKMLSNANFVAKAPASLVDAEKQKLERNEILKKTIMEKMK